MEIKINVKCLGKGEVNLEVSCNADEAVIMKDLIAEQLRFEEHQKHCNDTKKFGGLRKSSKPWRQHKVDAV